MKKILINGLLLNEGHGGYSGVHYYIEHLVHTLSQIKSKSIQFEVLLSKNYRTKITESDSLKKNILNLDSTNRVRRIFYENYSINNYAKINKFSAYHSPAYILPFNLSVPSIVTIHDLITQDFPELCQNESVYYFNLFIPNTIKKAHKIIVVSEKVKQDILHRYPQTDESKIEVINLGVSEDLQRVEKLETLNTLKFKYNLPDKFLLFVGNLEPKKNIVGILKAFLILKKEVKIPHKLVLVGKKGWKFKDIFDFIKKEKMESDVILTGYVPEEDLPGIYTLAEIFLFPSFYEGFGLPALEAMACGCPTIVSNRGSLPEITNYICPMVNPESISDLAKTIKELLGNQNLKENLSETGIKWAKKFTWNKTAEKTIDLYLSIK